MKTLVFSLLFLLIFPIGIFASDFDDVMKAYEQGNYIKVKELYQKNSDLGDTLGCGGLGGISSHAKSVNQDYNEMARSYRRSCNIWRNASACTNLGTMYLLGLGVDPDLNDAIELYQKACDLGDSDECLILGPISDFYYTVKGSGLNYTQLALIFQNDCNNGDGLACVALGFAYESGLGVDQDLFEAAEYFQRACDLGYEEGCAGQGIILLILGEE